MHRPDCLHLLPRPAQPLLNILRFLLFLHIKADGSDFHLFLSWHPPHKFQFLSPLDIKMFLPDHFDDVRSQSYQHYIFSLFLQMHHISLFFLLLLMTSFHAWRSVLHLFQIFYTESKVVHKDPAQTSDHPQLLFESCD